MGQDSLNGNIHSWCVEGLKHDLSHLFPVGLRVEWGLCEKDWVLLRCNTELIVKCVMPDLLHVIPVSDNAVLDGVLQGKNTPLGLGLVSHIGVLLSHANHDTLVTWASNNGREDSTGGIISSESSLAHAGAIVDNESGNFLFIHGEFFEFCGVTKLSCWWDRSRAISPM